jgi:hypothetical protein
MWDEQGVSRNAWLESEERYETCLRQKLTIEKEWRYNKHLLVEMKSILEKGQ